MVVIFNVLLEIIYKSLFVNGLHQVIEQTQIKKNKLL